jgi:response regulator RpfG family c-di-GMP phosphodiesterase
MSAKEKKPTVLILDDEPDVAAYLEMLLQDNGYDTVTAGDGKVGFVIAQKEKPDLVLLDINMPEESGVRFYRNLKDDPDLSATPVLLVTAVTGLGGDPEPFRRFMSRWKHIPAPEGFFSKPIDREAFLAKVKELVPVAE